MFGWLRRRIPVLTPPALDAFPDQTGKALGFDNIVTFATQSNGRFSRTLNQWMYQERPQIGDVLVTLTSDSMGMTVREDIRGTVSSIAWSDGWNQPYVEVTYILPDYTVPQKLRFPLSEVLRLTGFNRTWVTSR